MKIRDNGNPGPLNRPALLWGLPALAMALVMITAAAAHAHKVYIYAWVEGDTVYTESYFGAKRKVQNSPVRVFDPSGREVAQGRTNDRGEFSFKAPAKTDLRIVVEAGMGHKNEFVLKAEEFTGGAPSQVRQVPGEEPVKAGASLPRKEAEQVRVLVEQALDAKLRPVMRELAKIRQEKGPGLSEILGGIGYIFGIMGLILYLRSRGKDSSN
jgi:nickel transport protein